MTNNNPSPEDLAAHKASERARYSTKAISSTLDANPGSDTILARILSSEAMTHTGASPGNYYRHMLFHDKAADRHAKAANNLLPGKRYSIGEEAYNRYTKAINDHNTAEELHRTLAHKSAGKLGMDLNTDRELRKAMQEHRDDEGLRLIYGDWLEEHGLPKEASGYRATHPYNLYPIAQRATDQ